jgi:hypothetical protein
VPTQGSGRLRSERAHPTDFGSPFPCPFCHDPTLQHYRLSNVTKSATSRTFRKRCGPHFRAPSELMRLCSCLASTLVCRGIVAEFDSRTLVSTPEKDGEHRVSLRFMVNFRFTAAHLSCPIVPHKYDHVQVFYLQMLGLLVEDRRRETGRSGPRE